MHRVFALLLTMTAAAAQDANIDDVVIPRKTDIFVQLERSLSSKSAGVGDRFHARLTVPITVDDRIVVPVGSYFIGQVDHSKRPGFIKGKAEMTLAFDTVILPSGVTRKIVAVAQSAEGHERGRGAQEGKITASSDQADQVITSASAGGALGGAIGGARAGSLKGFGVGAALGAATGVVLGLIARGRDVTLPRGAAITIQLQQDAQFVKPEEAVRGKPLKP